MLIKFSKLYTKCVKKVFPVQSINQHVYKEISSRLLNFVPRQIVFWIVVLDVSGCWSWNICDTLFYKHFLGGFDFWVTTCQPIGLHNSCTEPY